ncbi:MAG: Mur ligase family protein [Gallionella sp.]
MTCSFPPFLQRLYEAAASGTDRRLMYQRFPLFLQLYDVPEACTLIKITGTNGKGSVCSMLESSLMADGKTVGLFTSPHLICVSERIRINQQSVSLTSIEQQAQQLHGEFLSFSENYGETYRLTFFECLLVIALRLFNIHKVDFAVIETGIGGYNDASHFLNAHYSAITSIALDHLSLLGDTLEKIAADKAGIASDNSTLVVSETLAEPLLSVLANDCTPRGVTLKIASADISDATIGLHGTRFNFSCHGEKLPLALPLLGAFQLQNFAVAACLFECLYRAGLVHQLASLQGIQNCQWAARMEYYPGSPAVLFDVAHNLHALEALTHALESLIPKAQRVVLCGFSTDKDFRTGLQKLATLSDMVYLTEGFYKAIPTQTLQTVLPEVQPCFQSPDAGLAYLQRYYQNQDVCIIVAGSVFLAATARQAFLQHGY